MLKEYHKIDGLYKRELETKKLLQGEYRNEAVSYLKDNTWIFTEKIDGTNIRIHWDGHRVTIAGRTDKSNIPSHLMERLENLFLGEANEQVFEEHFEEKDVTLYGEGYGPKIQNGGNYRQNVDFILFDVEVNDVFLTRDNVEEVAKYFGIDVVPIVFVGTIPQAEKYVSQRPSSFFGKAMMEGLVGRPQIELSDRNGKRVIVKIKVSDFDEIDKQTTKQNEKR